MKNIWKWILLAALLVGLIVGASMLYNNLSTDYKGDNLNSAPESWASSETPSQSEATSEETETAESSAPDFTVLDKDGKEVKLSDFKGKPVVINFWATWCYYCKEEMPDFNKAYEEFPDVQFLMVNATDGVQETKEKAEAYVKEQGFDFEVFFDTNREAVTNYQITGYPATFFVDSKGSLVTYASGMIDYVTLSKGIGMITD